MVDGVCWVEQVVSTCSTPNDDQGLGISTGNILYFMHAITDGCVGEVGEGGDLVCVECALSAAWF